MVKSSKRIELNEDVGSVKIKASRTGGINAAIRPSKGVTLNSKHGARVSSTYKGLTLGLQNFNSVVRGRWSSKDEGINVNLSKSGFSASVKNSLGSFNLKNPNRSSATILGIQVRGKNAAWIAGLGFVLDLLIVLFKLSFAILKRLSLISLWIIVTSWDLLKLIGAGLIFTTIDIPKQIKSKRIPKEE